MNSSISMIVMLVLLFGFMYFAMIRPQRKQQQQRQAMLSSMKKGDNVVTIGGLHGVIDSIDNAKQTVVLNAGDVYLLFNLSAIRLVEGDPATQPATPAATTTPEAPATPETPAASDADKSDDKPANEA
ncbi:preprotein translocase subunit YajC [Lacticaseibacillus brantae]|nr:preprotein translocase subunit YajC [Lacticaseibacillus brantae]